MSIYSLLGIAPPVAAYSTFQQVSIPVEEYTPLALDWHSKIANEAKTVLAEVEKNQADALQKFSQTVKGSLNQFLSTPINSDDEEVRRILAEGFEKFSEQIFAGTRKSSVASWESQVLSESAIFQNQSKPSPNIKKLLTGGKKLFNDIGFKPNRASAEIYESFYEMRGMLDLDVLEYIIDKCNSIVSESGQRQDKIVGQWSGVYQFLAGSSNAASREGLWEAIVQPTLPFSEGEVKMRKLTETLSKEFNLHSISLWRQKFGLKKERMLSLRISFIPDVTLLHEIVKWMSSADAGLKQGSGMIVKKIIS
jgi:hypothetical protein